MAKRGQTADAVAILHRRYVGEQPERQASLQEERINARVARIIFDLRQEAGLSQAELAAKIGTTQSVISRLEDSDYEGHSLSIFSRIADALNQRIEISVVPRTTTPPNSGHPSP